MGCCVSKSKLLERSEDDDRSTDPPLNRAPEVEGNYAWIRPSEAVQIQALREALSPSEQAELAAAPEDIRHDLMLCRFLRGHGTLPKALEALRALLKFRYENREIISRARDLFPTDLEHYTPEVGLHWEQMADRFIQLQLPGHRGTNAGMPVSLLVSRFFNLDLFASSAEVTMKEWFLSCVEQRSYTLHKQSMREQRMARVMEMRDMLGFSWSQFLARPLYMRKVMSVFKCGEFYPELLDVCLLCNLRPGGKEAVLLNMIVRMFPGKFSDKVLWAETSDWETMLCSQRGVSLNAMSAWIQHLRHADCREQGMSPHTLTSTRWQALDSLTVASGDMCEWHVRSESITRKAAVRVCAWFFKKPKKQQLPQASKCCEWEVLALAAGGASSTRGSYQVPDDGTVLVEVLLQGSAPVRVSIAFGPAGHLSDTDHSDGSKLHPSLAPAHMPLMYTALLPLLALLLAFCSWPSISLFIH